MNLTPIQRRKFSKSSSEKICLIRFLASIEECVDEKLKENNDSISSAKNKDAVPPHVMRAAAKIFKQYDEDGSGAIDREELAAMIQQLSKETSSLDTATSFVMSTLCGGKDDELLTLDAFACWVSEGIKLTPTERKIFARSGSNKAVRDGGGGGGGGGGGALRLKKKKFFFLTNVFLIFFDYFIQRY
jgi:hypothetical protein